MDTRKILIANSYIIGTAMIAFSFVWMISLAIMGGSFVQVMIAFSLTLAGIVFWWLGYHYNAKMKLTPKHTTISKKRVKESDLRTW